MIHNRKFIAAPNLIENIKQKYSQFQDFTPLISLNGPEKSPKINF